mmetsp:Transcript_4563/g.8375  ORF Transcript_4563/g.8375 Transcript_4563/m.8375 type:complete len:254 (+) Transcript_4563:410-1171(+)
MDSKIQRSHHQEPRILTANTMDAQQQQQHQVRRSQPIQVQSKPIRRSASHEDGFDLSVEELHISALLSKGKNPLLVSDKADEVDKLIRRCLGIEELDSSTDNSDSDPQGVADATTSPCSSPTSSSVSPLKREPITLKGGRAELREIDLKLLVETLGTASVLVEQLSDILDRVQYSDNKCILYIMHLELLFVIMENKAMFFPTIEEQWRFSEVIELLRTLLRFGNLQVICLASPAGHQLIRANSFVKVLTPIAI